MCIIAHSLPFTPSGCAPPPESPPAPRSPARSPPVLECASGYSTATGVGAESTLIQIRQNQALLAEESGADAHSLRIQKRAGLTFNLPEGGLQAKRPPIRPVRGHCLHHVRYCQNL